MNKKTLLLGALCFMMTACTEPLPDQKETLVPENSVEASGDQENHPSEQAKENEKQDEAQENSIQDLRLHKPVIAAGDVLEYQKVEIPDQIEKKDVIVWGYYDTDQFLVALYQDQNTEQAKAEIGIYDTKKTEYQALITEKEEGKIAGPSYFDDNYIVYTTYTGQGAATVGENPEPLKNRLRIYDIKQKKDQLIHEYPTWVQGNSPVLWQDKLYFDDFTENNESSTIYRYDIKTDKKEKVADGYMAPVVYLDDIAVFSHDSDKSDTLYRLNGEKIMELPGSHGDYHIADQKIFYIKDTPMEGAVIRRSLEEIHSGDTLLDMTGMSLGNLQGNKKYLWWIPYMGEEKPILYSIEKDHFLQFDDLPQSVYRIEAKEEMGLLSIRYIDNSLSVKRVHYRFNPK